MIEPPKNGVGMVVFLIEVDSQHKNFYEFWLRDDFISPKHNFYIISLIKVWDTD